MASDAKPPRGAPRFDGREEVERWLPEPFADGGKARRAGQPLSSIPSIYLVGDRAQQSWRAGWNDADQGAASDYEGFLRNVVGLTDDREIERRIAAARDAAGPPPSTLLQEKMFDLCGDGLTARKAASVAQSDGKRVTGFVLADELGKRCIVEMGAVRWLDKDGAWALMHPGEDR